MFKIPRQEYTAEFKELAVKRVRSGQGIAAVAREFQLQSHLLASSAELALAERITTLEEGLAFAKAGASGVSEAELRENVGIDPLDHDSRLALATLLAGQRRYREAMEELLEIIRLARHWQDGAARSKLLALFTLAGNDTALVAEYRRKLANALH